MKKYSWILVLLLFIAVNIVFNYGTYWSELFFDRSTIGGVWGEVRVYEWLTDKFYRTILEGDNPFGMVKGMLYPFDIHVGLTDAGNGLFYLFLRPFFSIHQSMAVTVALANLIACIGMYLLLRKLGFSRLLSTILGLAYGYTTFIMPRNGHLNYWNTIYLFPWFYYFVLSLIRSSNALSKILYSFGIAIFFVLTLWLNFYYFIILLISIFSYGLYLSIFKFNSVFKSIQKLWRYVFLTIMFIFILLIPWIKGMQEIVTFDELPKTVGWGGAIEFSSDLFHYFFPDRLNYIISNFFLPQYNYLLAHYFKFADNVFENFTYPGIIIIFSYFSYFLIFRKKSFKSINEKLKPFLFTSFVFFILTLGPFLHVLGHWGLSIDEGIRIVVPLPYIILHYIPFLANIRIPGRLIIGFIFFAYIVCAYILTYLLKNKPIKFQYIFFIILFLIFFIDHRYADNIVAPIKNYPYKLYNEIKKDSNKFTVLEIPFTVRDGFTYFGDMGSIDAIIGEAIYNKPTLGGYTGRISDYKKAYYLNNPFFGYLGRLIDTNLQYNPIIDKNDLKSWQNLDISKSKDIIEFLNIKYILTDNHKPYSATVSAVLRELDFNKKADEKNYSLWAKNQQNKEFLSINMNTQADITQLGMGWYEREDGFRWANRRSFVIFKIKKTRKMDLNFQAEAFYQNQPLTIYINKKKIAKIILDTRMKDYKITINNGLEEGLNNVHFIFEKSYKIKDVISNINDQRKISAKFTKIYLTNIQ